MNFDEVLIEILNEFAEGKNIDVEKYCLKYPQYKDSIISKLKIAEYIKNDLEEEDLSGKKLNEYIILKELGRGGMGIVFLAIHSELSRLTAIKILPSSISNDKEALKKFQEEAKIIAKFNHPNIVPIYSISNERGMYYIAMGYIPGPSLNNIIDKIRNTENPLHLKSTIVRDMLQLPTIEQSDISQKNIGLKRNPSFWNKNYIEFVLTIGSEIASALDYAHQSKITHGDIKPSNILLSSEGFPMIVDFGLSKDFKNLSTAKNSEFTGSLVYAAPEQIKDNITNEKTDLWALGVTLYELLTFRKPFQGNTIKKTSNNIQSGNLIQLRTLDKNIPKEVEAIINKCLEVNPANRYGTIGDLSSDLKNFLESKPIKARPDGIIQKIRKSIVRQPRLASLIIILFFLIPTIFIAIGNHLIWYKLREAENLFDNKKHNDAMTIYKSIENIIKVWPYKNEEIRSETILGTAINLERIKNYTDAFKYYNDYLNLDYQNNIYQAYRGIGDYYFRNKKYNLALDNYKKMMESVPNDSWKHFSYTAIATVLFDTSYDDYLLIKDGWDNSFANKSETNDSLWLAYNVDVETLLHNLNFSEQDIPHIRLKFIQIASTEYSYSLDKKYQNLSNPHKHRVY